MGPVSAVGGWGARSLLAPPGNSWPGSKGCSLSVHPPARAKAGPRGRFPPAMSSALVQLRLREVASIMAP